MADSNPKAPGSAGGPLHHPRTLTTFVTTTTYGDWLPGDVRGFVHDGEILPPNPTLWRHARGLMSHQPVLFTVGQITVLDHAIRLAAAEFGYTLTDLSIEPWHLHWIIEHQSDSVEAMVGRLKTRMRQAINRGRIWTEGYCHRCLTTPDEIVTARGYIARHRGCRMVDGRAVGEHGERSPG